MLPASAIATETTAVVAIPADALCSRRDGASDTVVETSEGPPSAVGGWVERWLPSSECLRVLVVSGGALAGVALVIGFGFLAAYDVAPNYVAACVLAGYCAMLAVVLSLQEIWLHISCYTAPDEQRRIVRILLMVPIFATQSWLALRFRHTALYLNLMRDCYESFVVYTFFSLLMVYLEGEKRCVELLEGQPRMRFLPPLCCCGSFRLGGRFVSVVKVCLLQYVAVKPLCAIVAMVLYPLGLYTEGAISNFGNGYVWLLAVANLSVTTAFGALLYFYVATHRLISQHKPLWKFFCIKVVIFLSFWQGLAVALLIRIHVIHSTVTMNVNEVAMALQDFLICVEMVFIALAHRTVFSHRPFLEAGGGILGRPSAAQLRHALHPVGIVREVVSEFSGLLGHDQAALALHTLPTG
eukprot:RCo025391